MTLTAMPAGLVAVGDALDEEHTLGRIGIYGHPDEDHPLTDVLRAWGSRGLDVADLPDVRRPVDFFMTACASVKKRRRGDGERWEIAADEFENIPGRCAYQITMKRWDQAERVIEHEKAMRLTFDKATSVIEVTPLDGWTADLKRLEDAIRNKYRADVRDSTVTGNKIRNAIRELLLAIGAQNLRSPQRAGGVYFVPREYTTKTGQRKATLPILEGLQGFVDNLYGERGNFHLVRCANDEGEREMVRKHFTVNVGARVDELREKLVERVRSGRGRGVRQELIDNTLEEYRQIHFAIKDFDALVGVERSDLATKIGDLDAAIAKLREMAA